MEGAGLKDMIATLPFSTGELSYISNWSILKQSHLKLDAVVARTASEREVLRSSTDESNICGLQSRPQTESIKTQTK